MNGPPELPIRVLIADDHEPTRAEIRRAIEADSRFRVCADVPDAAAAIKAALRDVPDICLLDVSMPGSGLAAAWEIGSRLPESKIVMLTVSDADRDLMAALNAGATGYLLKSMDRRRLSHALWDIKTGTFTVPRQLVGTIVDHVRAREPRHRSLADARTRLTSREWEILDLLAQGFSTREVAERLSLSPTGVRVHTSSAVKKLGVSNREAAVAAFRRG